MDYLGIQKNLKIISDQLAVLFGAETKAAPQIGGLGFNGSWAFACFGVSKPCCGGSAKDKTLPKWWLSLLLCIF